MLLNKIPIKATDFPHFSMKDIQEKEASFIHKTGISTAQLMEIAGFQAASWIYHHSINKKITLLAGKGNNGGDAFVIARHLYNFGHQPTVICPFEKASLSPLTQDQCSSCETLSIPVYPFNTAHLSQLGSRDILIDGLIGIGLTSDIR